MFLNSRINLHKCRPIYIWLIGVNSILELTINDHIASRSNEQIDGMITEVMDIADQRISNTSYKSGFNLNQNWCV